MKVLVTGVSGQLGFDVMRELLARGIEAKGASRSDFSLTDFAAMRRFVEAHRPTAIIHCAAYTAVDKAEDEPELCREVNAAATGELARLAKEVGAKFLYISTDYVFPGTGEGFYEPEDEKAPCNVYGESKLLGEEAAREALEDLFIVRISWVFGENGKNFIKTMLQVGKSHEEVRVVNDQIGNPTYTLDLAELLCDMICTEKYGTYHATNEGEYISWYDFTKEIYRQAGLSTKVIPVSTEEYGLSKAKRPKNSRLDKRKLKEEGFTPLPEWKDALSRYLEALKAEGID